MEINPKAMARTKHIASRRGRPRPARGRGPKNAHNISTTANKSAQVIEAASEEDRDSEEEENKGKSRGLDYAELLSQQPISYYGQLPGLPDMSSISLARGVDNLGWGFDDIYDGNVSDTAASDAASMLSLNLEILGRELGKLPLHELLMVDDDDTLLNDMLRQEVSSSSASRVLPDSSGAYEEKSIQMVYDEKTVQVVNTGISNKQGRLDASNLHQSSGAVNEEHFSRDFGSSSEITDTTSLQQSSGVVNKEHLSWDIGLSSEVIQDGKKELKTQKMKISSSLASFQPAAAEAELDALLDMLDSVQLNENSITVPSEPSSSLPEFTLATNKGQEHDSFGKQALQCLETGPVGQDPKLPVLSDDLQENFDAWLDSL